MQVHLKNQRKPLHKTAFVHSIDDAAHRPKEIDRWIESVMNIQSAKSLAKVSGCILSFPVLSPTQT